MAKIKYIILKYGWGSDLEDLIKNKIISSYSDGVDTIVARYGVNKTTLKKLLKEEK